MIFFGCLPPWSKQKKYYALLNFSSFCFLADVVECGQHRDQVSIRKAPHRPGNVLHRFDTSQTRQRTCCCSVLSRAPLAASDIPGKVFAGTRFRWSDGSHKFQLVWFLCARMYRQNLNQPIFGRGILVPTIFVSISNKPIEKILSYDPWSLQQYTWEVLYNFGFADALAVTTLYFPLTSSQASVSCFKNR